MSQIANEINAEWLQKIKEKIEGLQYGTVQVTIHSGKIVQIDRTERTRFDKLSSRPLSAQNSYSVRQHK
ncbi:YezD family protein [Paenibacillus sp. 32O-W]|uniref:YezD family protein n=1 Tax=Paenibacillus sp. 32O-W TaxID=1695218 RepID=UPI0019110024|nr:YezD family protein [Paenibacillus sp. 32O-W]